MSDTYLELANSNLGKKLFSAMGLPEPVSLVREDPKEPHKLSGQVLWGNSHGAAFYHTLVSEKHNAHNKHESAGYGRYNCI